LKRQNLRLFDGCVPSKKKKKKMSTDIGSVPDTKIDSSSNSYSTGEFIETYVNIIV